jgi:tetraacyldisaccharide 4'-kinase
MKVSRSASLALWPLSQLYGSVVRLRTALYRSGIFRGQRLNGTVISVGNVTLGGTGKTPMVLWIAERVAADGNRAAILTRGYRGKQVAGAADQPSSLAPSVTSDEVMLLQRTLGDRAWFGVGKDRYRNGRKLEAQGAQWFILDDGFQHLQLARDVDIVMLDATDAFGGGRMLPAGRLREPRAGLSRADVVVITRADHAPAVETIVRRFTNAPIFYAHTELAAIVKIESTRESAMAGELAQVDRAELDRMKPKVLAFCGIGNAGAFFYDLRRWGFFVVAERAFPDHHRYRTRDMDRLEGLASSVGANAMICTEKDIFNLTDVPLPKIPLYACKIRLALLNGDAFWKTVLEVAAKYQASKSKPGAAK